MTSEREALQVLVFPKLRELCQRNGCRFQAIDLRWGISEEADLDQRTITICLTELQRCQTVSPGVNCLILLGNRYGWQPLPTQIEAAEMAALLSQMTAPDQQRVRRWYQEDHNAVPAAYVLLPRTGEFLSSKRWQHEELELLSLLRQAAAAALSEDRRARYHQSATRLEIEAALLHAEGAEKHVFACLRDLPTMPLTAAAAGFLDLNPDGTFDESAWKRNEALKQEVRDRLPPESVYSYRGNWPYEPGQDAQMDEFCCKVEAHFTRILQHEISRLGLITEGAEENREHLCFARDRANFFIGRSLALARIDDYLHSTEPYPLILHGPSGAGKTAVMARAFLDARQTWGSSALVIARLVGATPKSRSLHALLGDLLGQLEGFGNEESEVPSEINDRVALLSQRLSGVKLERPVLIFLDALDQLEPSDHLESLFWLLQRLPSHVRVVVSVLDRSCDLAGRAAIFARQIFPSEAHYRIEPLDTTEGATLLDGWLRAAGRRLQPTQRHTLLNGFVESGLPLWLRIATDHVLVWRSFDQPRILPPSIPALIEQRISELSLPQNHGRLLVARAFGYISAARTGLSEDELLEVLARDPDMWSHFVNTSKHPIPAEKRQLPVVFWSRLHLDIAGFLCEVSADRSRLLNFYHRELGEAVSRMFRSATLHSRLADYFSQEYGASESDSWKAASQPAYLGVCANRPTALRALTELPNQLRWSDRMPELARLLSNYEFLTAKCAANRSDALVEDLDLLAGHRSHLPVWDGFVRTQAALLRRGVVGWPAHRILWQLSLELPEAHPIRAAAAKWFTRFCPPEPVLISAFSRESERGPTSRTVELPKELLDCREDRRLKRIKRMYRENGQGCVDPSPDACAAPCDAVMASESEVLPIAEEALLVRYSDGEAAVLSQKTGRITVHIETALDKIHTLEVFGTTLVVLRVSGRMQLIDVTTGVELHVSVAEGCGVSGVAALNAEQFLVGYHDGRLIVRERRGGHVVVRKDGGQEISGLFVLPNGRILASSQTGRVTVLDSTLEVLFVGDILRSLLKGVGQLANGKSVLWDDTGSLTLLDWHDLARFCRLEGHPAPTEGILPDCDGGFVSWCADSVIQLWSPCRPSPLVFKVPGILGRLVRGSNDTLVVIYVCDPMLAFQTKERHRNWSGFLQYATLDRDRLYYFADLIGLICLSMKTFRILDHLEPSTRGGVLGALVVAGQHLVTWSLMAPVTFWCFNGQKIRELPDIELRTLDRLVFVSLQRFLSVHTCGRVRLWNAVDGSEIGDLRSIHGRVTLIRTISEDIFATITDDLTIRLWATGTGQPLACLQGHGSSICGLLRPNPQALVSWTKQGEIKLWDLDEVAGLWSSRSAEYTQNSSAVRLGGGMAQIVRQVSATSIVSCHWGVIKSWDVRSGELIARLDLIPDMINCLEVVCPDVVVFWCRGFTVWHDVYLWLVTEPRPLARFELYKDSTNVDDVWVRKIGGHERPIYDLCLQGDNETEFNFRFDDQLRPLEQPSAVEDGIQVFRGLDYRTRPHTVRGTLSPYERKQARFNVHVDQKQRFIVIESAAGVMQWHSNSPAAFVEQYSDGLYCVALENGEIRLLRLIENRAIA
ncbi:MAG: AAA family ATPase [Verrucomicrobiales bacterium]|nr:AAA family ATPase [Verrucomicrobiales bacterium]